MSESAASYHPTSGAEEFDRRMRSLGQAPSDALAELARLVGHHDPFGEDNAVPAGNVAAVTTTPAAVAGDEHEFAAMDFEPSYPETTHLGEEPGAPSEPAIVHPLRAEPAAWERAVPRFPSISPRDEHAIEPSPDIWAQGSEDHHGSGSAPAIEASREAPASVEPSSAKRTLVVLVAVVALTGGGLAASFLARPSNPSASAATTAPTIMAATGPSKVQPETPTAATGEDAPSEPSKLLDKNGNDGTATAKVVNNVEQPVDLAQAIKPSTPDPSTDAAPASPFPQPRKVKTISVRPDGSVIADAPPPAVPATSEASLAFDPQTAMPPVTRDPAPVSPPPVVMPVAAEPTIPTDAAPAPASAKATTRITSPKPAASTAQEGSAASQSRSPVATPKAKPKPKPKPVAAAAPAPAEEAAPVVAEAAPAAGDAAPAAEGEAGGKFAIQLGAAPSEAEGRAAATRLGQKFAGDLGGASPSVHKAQAGGKTVYRIRVGNLSQEAAKALCAKVQAAGGGCFVARN